MATDADSNTTDATSNSGTAKTGILDWFKKAKAARDAKAAEKEAAEKAQRADQGDANYKNSQGESARDAWVALDE